jgi:hypothetical protein
MSKSASPSPEPIPSTMASCSVATRIVESSSRPITAPMVFARTVCGQSTMIYETSRKPFCSVGCTVSRKSTSGRNSVVKGKIVAYGSPARMSARTTTAGRLLSSSSRTRTTAPRRICSGSTRRLRGFLFKRGGRSLFIRRQLGEPSALIGETRSIIGIPSIGQPKHDRARALGPAPQARPNLRGSDLSDQVVNLTSKGGELFAQASAYDAKILRFRHNG